MNLETLCVARPSLGEETPGASGEAHYGSALSQAYPPVPYTLAINLRYSPNSVGGEISEVRPMGGCTGSRALASYICRGYSSGSEEKEGKVWLRPHDLKVALTRAGTSR
jgi:hypothetical protein